jgi:hypothetical protein
VTTRGPSPDTVVVNGLTEQRRCAINASGFADGVRALAGGHIGIGRRSAARRSRIYPPTWPIGVKRYRITKRRRAARQGRAQHGGERARFSAGPGRKSYSAMQICNDMKRRWVFLLGTAPLAMQNCAPPAALVSKDFEPISLVSSIKASRSLVRQAAGHSAWCGS